MNIIPIILICSVAIVADAFHIRKRIVGGDEVPAGKPNHHASVLINSVYACGAIVISLFHLLTAAHCLYEVIRLGPFKKVVAVLVGSTTLNDGIFHAVKRISHHRNFSKEHPYLYRDDIGMIHVVIPMEIPERVLPVALPIFKYMISENFDLIVTGFGNQEENGPYSETLSQLLVTTQNYQTCQNKYSAHILKPSIICSSLRRGLGCTPGDEGSGVTDVSQKMLVGIVSVTGNGYCCNKPDIYTQVSHYIEYINQEIAYFQVNLTTRDMNPGINFDFQSLLSRSVQT